MAERCCLARSLEVTDQKGTVHGWLTQGFPDSRYSRSVELPGSGSEAPRSTRCCRLVLRSCLVASGGYGGTERRDQICGEWSAGWLRSQVQKPAVVQRCARVRTFPAYVCARKHRPPESRYRLTRNRLWQTEPVRHFSRLKTCNRCTGWRACRCRAGRP